MPTPPLTHESACPVVCNNGSTTDEIALQPLQHQLPHPWCFLVAAIEQLDAATFFPSVAGIRRRKMLAPALPAGWRRQQILATIEAKCGRGTISSLISWVRKCFS